MICKSFENLSFFRGVSNPLQSQEPKLYSTRKNRIPRDMPTEFHTDADIWFESTFGTKYRTQSVFVSSNLFTATQYAHNKSLANVIRVIPIGPYKYCWSEKYNDLLSYVQYSDKLTIHEYLSLGNYTETNLDNASQTGNEVMLACDQYIGVPVNLLADNNSPKQTSHSEIILLK